jgi:hypothetical protein
MAIARHIFGSPTTQYLNAIVIATNQAIADTGVTSIFVMDNIDMVNKHIAKKSLTINLPDRKQVISTHICDINNPGLPMVLNGHIVPSLTVASLIGIHPLCKAGCTVLFDNKKCDVILMEKLFYEGTKTRLPIYGCYRSQQRCVPPQDLLSCHDPAPILIVPHTLLLLPKMPSQTSIFSNIHTLCADPSQHHENFPPIAVQAQDYFATQSYLQWVCQRVPKYDEVLGPQVPQSKTRYSQGPHKMPTA